MSKEKEMKQHLQQYDKDTLIELYLQKDFDTKQQLAEKDKEIESWKENSKMWENWKETYYKKLTEVRQQLKDQRHQICEKIKEFCKEYGTEDDNGALTINIDKRLHTDDNLLDFLEKYEKGE